jgi:CrcB protein
MIASSTLLAVAAGGALGAVGRLLVSRWATATLGPGFPWGTMIVNVAGGFLMGLAAVLMMERAPGAWGRLAPFVMTGVLGGFTTFSAFSLDALFLIERGETARAALYVGGSVALSIGALWAGLTLARAL